MSQLVSVPPAHPLVVAPRAVAPAVVQLTPVGSHDSRVLRSLDLAGLHPPKKPPVHPLLDERVNFVVKPHTLYNPILQPSSIPPLQVEAPAAEVQAAIRPDVESFTPQIDYNGLNVVTQFIHFVQRAREANEEMEVAPSSEAEAFLHFHVDAEDDVAERAGSACSGQSSNLLDRLAKKHGFYGYQVVERASAMAPPHHALGAIFCEDGVVIVDPSLHARHHKAIIVRPGEVTTATNIYNGKMEFRMLPGSKIIEKTSFTPSGPVRSEIVLRNLVNPDQCVMKQFMLNRPWFAITGCDAEGLVVSVLRVDIGQEKLIFQQGTGSSAIKLSLPFSAFNPETQEFDLEKIPPADRERFLSFRIGFFSYFKISKRALFSQIALLVKNKKVIQNLYNQTRAPKTPAPC